MPSEISASGRSKYGSQTARMAASSSSTRVLGGLAFGKPLLGYVFDQAFKLDQEGWRKLTLRWGLFFVVLAILNEVVWRTTSTDFWVAFKVWATMPITMAFMLAQFPLLKRHALEPLFGEKR